MMRDYFDELINLNLPMENLKQLSNETPDKIIRIDCDPQMSLVYRATSEYFEFINGEPKILTKYYIYFIVGSSKNSNDIVGTCTINENEESIYEKCYFHDDFFILNPSIIKKLNCSDMCHVNSNLNLGLWCKKCHGDLTLLNLNLLFKKDIKIANIPKDAVFYIEKKLKNVEFNNLIHLTKIKNYLVKDKKKIELLQLKISNAQEKIKKLIDLLQPEIKNNQIIMEMLLSYRGGSMEKYLDTINDINQKINFLKS